MKSLAMGLAAFAAVEAFAIQGSVSTETETFAGDVKWHARDKKYVIQKDKIIKEFKLADVTALDIPKPLSGLEGRPVRFDGVTDKADMPSVVDAFLK